MNFLDGSKIEQQRVLLAVYPLLCVPSSGACLYLPLFIMLQTVLFCTRVDDSDSMKEREVALVHRDKHAVRNYGV
jgi:hypothetical protein